MGRQDQVMDHLVEEGILDAESIEKLESTHQENDATALLVEDLVEEEALLQSLAIVYATAPAGYSKGLFIERGLLAKLDADMVREYELLPVRRHGDERVDIIVVEPLNEMARGIIEDLFELPIREYIWPRIRFLQARHYFLGDALPEWTRSYLRHHRVTLGYATPADEINVEEALRSSESLLVDQWRREDVRSFVKGCFDRDSLLKVLLGYSGHWLTNRLVVVVGRSGLQPYFMEEWPELAGRYDDVLALREVHVDPSAIDVLRDATTWQSGSPDELALAPLFDALGVEKPPLLVSIPLHIGGRTAMALLGVPTDTGASIRLEEISESFEIEPLQEAAQWVGEQLEEMIKQAKANTLPPPAERIPPLPKNTIQVGLGFEDSLVEERIARRRGGKNERHRWEIIDISQVTDDSEISEVAAPGGEASESSLSEASQDAPDPGATSFGMPALAEPSENAPDPGATSFGMPAIQEESSVGHLHAAAESEPESDGGLAELLAEDQEEPSKIDDGWNEILSGVEAKSIPQALKEKEEEKEESSVAEDVDEDDEDEVLEDADDDEVLEDADDDVIEEDDEDEIIEDADDDEILEDEVIEDEVIEDDEDEIIEDADDADDAGIEDEDRDLSEESSEVSESGVVRPRGPITGVTSLGGFSVADIAEEAPRASKKKSLNIPTSASGVPMAQIFRRAGQRKKQKKAEAPSTSEQNQAPNDSASSQFDREESITGRTIMGLGELPNFEDMPGESKKDDSEPAMTQSGLPSGDSSADASSWLDEIEEGAQPSDPEARPGGTVKMDADTARTQTFNELLVDMDSGAVADPNANPNTIPMEVLEEVPDSGPVAIEIEESLGLIDSRNPEIAFAAAEHLAVAGPFAVERLRPLFPGRIFVDRYQYTVSTMPPVNEHGPVLEALVRIGQPSLKVVEEFIDDASLECRFYATYLLTELPAQGLLLKLFDRLFDRDQQTRTLAQNIVYAHRSLESFPRSIVIPLRKVLEKNDEEFRVEIAVENLRRLKDLASVPLLIEALHEQPKRIRKGIHRALREITFQSFAPAPTDWRRWWTSAENEPRWRWLVEAMDSKDDELRMLAFDEIEQLPGLEFNYHPDQPSKLRIRAQKTLTEFFETQ